MKRLVIIVSLFSLLLLSQCGLERPLNVWSTPEYVSSYQFRTQDDHMDDPDRLFLGYEIYYKIKLNDYDFIGDENVSDANQLEAYYFKRFRFADDTSDGLAPPRVPIYLTNNAEEGLVYTIAIDYSAISSVVAQSVYRTYEVRRAIPYSPETHFYYPQYKRFSHFYNNDNDIAVADQIVFDGKNKGETFAVWIALYVYAYGIEFPEFTREIKSPPRYLWPTQIYVKYDDGYP